jgi:thiamine biosynthesis lipoprotein
MIQPSDIGARRFAHQAMHTEFEIFCVHGDGDYVQQACWAAFDVLDRLENELSRFIPNSDISRINHLSPGESVRVSRWTMECLELAREAFEETGGAFDISVGTGFERLELSPRDFRVTAPGGLEPTPPVTASGSGWGGLQPTRPVTATGSGWDGRQPARSVTASGSGLGGLQPARPVTPTHSASGIRLDLGGIGKGYAVDRMAEVLDEWDIRQALIHGGHSSVLALDAPPGLDGWPLTMGDRTVTAKRRAFSASGIRTQGDHIVDPRSGLPANGRMAAWVSLELAELDRGRSPGAVAEAFSTAFMILPAAEVDAIRARHPGLEAWLLERTDLCVQNSD